MCFLHSRNANKISFFINKMIYYICYLKRSKLYLQKTVRDLSNEPKSLAPSAGIAPKTGAL